MLASKIQDFQSIIQVYQLAWLNLGLSTIESHLDFRFDKPRFSICCTFGVENLGLSSGGGKFFNFLMDILDYQIEKSLDFTLGLIQDFSTYCTKQVENLGLSTEKSKFFRANCPIIWNQTVDFRKSKILDYQMIIQVFQSHIENLGLSIESPVLLENLGLSIENLGFSTE